MTEDNGLVKFWMLARKKNEQSTIVFFTLVKTERDLDSAEDHHAATIAGLEDRLVATGRTADEAEDAAIDLFRDLIDDAIENSSAPARTAISECLNGGVPFVEADKPLSKAEELFEEFGRLLDEKIRGLERDDSEEWLALAK